MIVSGVPALAVPVDRHIESNLSIIDSALLRVASDHLNGGRTQVGTGIGTGLSRRKLWILLRRPAGFSIICWLWGDGRRHGNMWWFLAGKGASEMARAASISYTDFLLCPRPTGQHTVERV